MSKAGPFLRELCEERKNVAGFALIASLVAIVGCSARVERFEPQKEKNTTQTPIQDGNILNLSQKASCARYSWTKCTQTGREASCHEVTVNRSQAKAIRFSIGETIAYQYTGRSKLRQDEALLNLVIEDAEPHRLKDWDGKQCDVGCSLSVKADLRMSTANVSGNGSTRQLFAAQDLCGPNDEASCTRPARDVKFGNSHRSIPPSLAMLYLGADAAHLPQSTQVHLKYIVVSPSSTPNRSAQMFFSQGKPGDAPFAMLTLHGCNEEG